MKRSLNAKPFNRIAAHPEVRPWLGYGMEDIDLTALVENPNNVCFLTEDEDGGYILAKLKPGLYSAHTLALPSARGKPMLSCMRDGFSTMFTATDAEEIVTMVPDGNEAASRWADVAGFRETFRREGFFPLMDQMVGASFRSLRYEDWVLKDPRHGKLGELFHERLDEAREEKGSHTHADDPVHNRWVGATLSSAIEGNLVKAVGHFNRWAVQSGYPQSQIVSVNPPVLDIGQGVVQLVSGCLDVLKVRANG